MTHEINRPKSIRYELNAQTLYTRLESYELQSLTKYQFWFLVCLHSRIYVSVRDELIIDYYIVMSLCRCHNLHASLRLTVDVHVDGAIVVHEYGLGLHSTRDIS